MQTSESSSTVMLILSMEVESIVVLQATFFKTVTHSYRCLLRRTIVYVDSSQ